MGSRKRNSANAMKELKKNIVSASLNNCPTSPRKMRLVADQIRGKKVSNALSILKFSPKDASKKLEKLLLSAISNWQLKNEKEDIEKAKLFISEIKVDGGYKIFKLNRKRLFGNQMMKYSFIKIL